MRRLKEILDDPRKGDFLHRIGRRKAGCFQPEKSPAVRIPILTMHAAKGLEFDTVFLPDLNEGMLPSRKSTSPEAIEEERRLLYVAMTRAKKRLELLYIAGGTTEKIPTRFIRVLGAKDAFGE